LFDQLGGQEAIMRATTITALMLALASGAVQAGPGDTWGQRTDGYYAPPKMAAEIKDYPIILSKELAADKARGWQAGDDTIASATWSYAVGITGGPESLIADPKITGSAGTGVVTWLAGGTAGQKYNISVTVITTQGRRYEFPFKIEVK
jgi:hypothetical protein